MLILLKVDRYLPYDLTYRTLIFVSPFSMLVLICEKLGQVHNLSQVVKSY